MTRYLAGRALRAFLTILAVVTFTFVVLNLSGDPATIILSPDAGAEAIEAFRVSWGLDRPLWEQYVRYAMNVARGEFGFSMRGGRPALEVVVERIPATLALTIPALLFKLLIGVPAGVLAALHRNTSIDRATVLAAVAGYTIPNFILGFGLVFVFAVTLRWFPSGGFEGARDLVLPVITLGSAGAAVIARFTRSAMVEVLGQPYIRAAQAKGVPWRRVVTHHALPNAAIPTVTIIGLMVGSLVAGAVVVESVFSWPGVGRLLVISVANRDLAVVQAILLIIASCMVTANFLVDLAYGWLDPRVRVTSAGQAS